MPFALTSFVNSSLDARPSYRDTNHGIVALLSDCHHVDIRVSLANLGISAHVLAGDGACTDKMNALAGDAISNLVCSEAGLPLARMPRGADFEKRYVERFKTPINAYAPFAYDAVYVIVDARKRADSTVMIGPALAAFAGVMIASE